jgi:5-methylcytosine-specific restriction protein A
MHPLCAECDRHALVTPGEVVDHVKELKDGGDPWDVDNLEVLCRPCHAKKTGEEVKKRSRNKGFRSISDF